MNLKEKMGITLIALVITIVVILILAAVTLNLTLGNKGIVKRAQEATLMNSKAQYYQEIDMEIVDEKMERSAKYKEEPFITSLANRLSPERKEWVTSVVKCAEVDGSIEKKENDMDNNLLLIMTKEGYEIFVDVNNSQLQASIRNDWKKEQKACTITYNANGGTGTDVSQSTRQGFDVTTKANPFERAGYSFIGWSEYQNGKDENQNDSIYAALGKIENIQKDMTLYAVWSQNFVTISFEANGGTGTMEPQNIGSKMEYKS